MSAWIGPLGNLIEFKCPSAVESVSEDPHVYFRPLGGSVSATILGDPTRPRVWDVQVSAARPDHVASLQSLAEGAWGPGPFVFIPPGGDALNLMGKRDALCLGVGNTASDYTSQRPGTPVFTSEGVAGSSYAALSPTPSDRFMGMAPVIPGKPFTVRAWLQAGASQSARVFARFYDAGNNQISATPVPATTSLTGEYVHATAITPAGAVAAWVYARGAIIANLQATWTSEPRTWSPSAASQNVVASPLSNSVRRATGVAGEEQITDHAFTVTELRA